MPKAFDLLVFGATGVTGRYVVEKLAETLHKRHLPIRWAIAVRNPEKMKTQLRQMEATVGITDLANQIPVMRADVNDATSMKKAFGSAKLVLNCIGPYSLLGEPVVKACVNSSKCSLHHQTTFHYSFCFTNCRISLHGPFWGATVSRVDAAKVRQ